MKVFLVLIILSIARWLINWTSEDIDWSWSESLPFSNSAWHWDLYNILSSFIIALFAIGSFLTYCRIMRKRALSSPPPRPPAPPLTRGIIKLAIIIITIAILNYLSFYIRLPKFLELHFFQWVSWYHKQEITSLLRLIIGLGTMYLTLLVIIMRNPAQPPLDADNPYSVPQPPPSTKRNITPKGP